MATVTYHGNVAGMVSALKAYVRQDSLLRFESATIALERNLIDAAPYDDSPHRDPGPHLRDSITVESSTSPAGRVFTAEARSDQPQAAWTNDGTAGPYPIPGNYPYRLDGALSKVLRWFEGGRAVFARHVMHPGIEGTGWWDDEVRRFPELLAAAGAQGAPFPRGTRL